MSQEENGVILFSRKGSMEINDQDNHNLFLLLQQASMPRGPQSRGDKKLLFKDTIDVQHKEPNLSESQILRNSAPQEDAIAPSTGKKLLLKKDGPAAATPAGKGLLLKKKTQDQATTGGGGKLLLKKSGQHQMPPTQSTAPASLQVKTANQEAPQKGAGLSTISPKPANQVSQKAMALRDKNRVQNSLGAQVKQAKSITMPPSEPAAPKKKPEPAPEQVTREYADSLGNIFCFVDKGEYKVGPAADPIKMERAFTIAKFPVTKSLYFTFLKEVELDYTPEQLNRINQISPYPDSPMVNISWDDAKAFCRWLRAKTGEYYSLPSDLQWEISARGTDGRSYPWGEEEPTAQMACFNDGVLEPESTASVDYYKSNVSPCGALGMAGNVMEWTVDSFDDERDPHILRGGSWLSNSSFCTTFAQCLAFPPSKRMEYTGLRLLYVPEELMDQYAQASE